MKKIKKPIKKSEIAQIVSKDWESRRAVWKMRRERNNKWTKEWKLKEKNNLSEENKKS